MAEAPEPPNARRTSPLPGRLNELSDPEQPVRHPERSRSATPTPPKRRPGRPRKNSLPLPAHHDSPSMSRTASALSQVQSIDNNPTLPTAGPSHQSQPDAWSSSDEQSSERDDLRGDKSYSARASRGAPARARGRGRGRGRGSKNTSATTPRSIDRTPSKTSDGLLSVPLPVTRSRSRSPSIEAHSRETSPRPAGVSAPPSLSSRRSRSPSAASAPAPLEGLQKGFPNPLKRRRSPKVSGLQSEQGQLDDASDGDSSDLSSAPGDFDRAFSLTKQQAPTDPSLGHRDPYAKKPRAATPDTDIPSPAVVGPAASFHSRGFSAKRKRLVTASSDSENSEASAAIPRASSLPLHSRGASKSISLSFHMRISSQKRSNLLRSTGAKRQSREQSRAEAESKRQR